MIYIFGDSFGDPPHSSDKRSDWTWPFLLQQSEDVKNLCEGGTGPLSAFQDFWRHFNDIKEDHESKIVFLLSDPYRIPFDFLKGNHQPEVGKWMHDPFKVMRNSAREQEQELDTDPVYCEYFKDYKKELFAFRHVMYGELKNLNTKNISLLKCLSMILEKKIIVFVCFSFDKIFDHWQKYVSATPEIKKLNDKYFKLYDRPLHDFSPDGLDSRPDYVTGLTPDEAEQLEFAYNNVLCHLNKEDHVIVYNIIMNHFYGGDRSEKFHFEMKKETGILENKFIYE